MTESEFDVLPRREIRFRPQRPARACVEQWRAYVEQAAQMPSDAALRLPAFGSSLAPSRSGSTMAERRDVRAAVLRYASGKLWVRKDVDGRLVLTRRRTKHPIEKLCGPGMTLEELGFNPEKMTIGPFTLTEPGFFKHRPSPLALERAAINDAHVAEAVKDMQAMGFNVPMPQPSCRPGPVDANGSPVEP